MEITLKKSQTISGEIELPGDKSITHRALITGAIASGKTNIKNPSTSKDCLNTIICLKSCGARIENKKDEITIEGTEAISNALREPKTVLNAGNSGTTIRLLSGVLAGYPFLSILTGDSSLNMRPMKRIIEPLRRMDCKIFGRENDAFPPLVIKGGNLQSINYKSHVASAQVKSCVLFAALYANDKTTYEEPALSRNHTEIMLNDFGATIETVNLRTTVYPSEKLDGQELFIPGDFSSAAFFITAAALAPNRAILLKNILLNPTRTAFLDIVRKMGVEVNVVPKTIYNTSEKAGDVFVKGNSLKSIEFGEDSVPNIIDEIPLIALLASCAEGTTIIRNAGELKHKESNRIKTTVYNLKRLGAQIEELPDGMLIKGPTKLRGTVCKSFGDHRIAMMAAVASTIAERETTIKGAECVGISFPAFFDTLKKISH